MELASGETLNLNGFPTVSPKKLDELPDDVYEGVELNFIELGAGCAYMYVYR